MTHAYGGWGGFAPEGRSADWRAARANAEAAIAEGRKRDAMLCELVAEHGLPVAVGDVVVVGNVIHEIGSIDVREFHGTDWLLTDRRTASIDAKGMRRLYPGDTRLWQKTPLSDVFLVARPATDEEREAFEACFKYVPPPTPTTNPFR